VQFEWDERKAAYNLAKHDIAFDQAIAVFNDPHHLTFEDLRADYGEVRLNTIGSIDQAFFVCVTHTHRSGFVRLISARPASRGERKLYHAHNS
jgi:uncharacterized protein